MTLNMSTSILRKEYELQISEHKMLNTELSEQLKASHNKELVIYRGHMMLS
jgi:hypothetical protein